MNNSQLLKVSADFVNTIRDITDQLTDLSGDECIDRCDITDKIKLLNSATTNYLLNLSGVLLGVIENETD